MLDCFGPWTGGIVGPMIRRCFLQLPAVFVAGLLWTVSAAVVNLYGAASSTEVLEGLRKFYAKTARADGSFANGIDPKYRGMSDSAYSDLAEVTYAVTLHKTFG